MRALHKGIVLFVVGAAFSFACSSSDPEAAPTRKPVTSPDDDAGSTATVDGGVDDAAVEPDASPDCIGDEGCFKCEPTKLVEFLNRCTDGQCVPFDNAARVPLYEPGKPLPPVP